MGTARDKAILLMKEAFDRVSTAPAPADMAPLIDAIIDAARASESAHTRAVAADPDQADKARNQD